ncbi:unnamed protein product, partial [Effrenium voratum]
FSSGTRVEPSDRSMRRLRALGLGLALWLGLTGLSDPAAVATAAAGDELLIYGAGYLGRRVAKLWQQQRPGAKVTCATRTAASHPQLAAEGWEALTTDELSGGTRRFAQAELGRSLGPCPGVKWPNPDGPALCRD